VHLLVFNIFYASNQYTERGTYQIHGEDFE